MGKLIVISAPSGAGKTSIVHFLLNKIEALSFSVSACSRAKRENETDGIDYYFFAEEEFQKKINKGDFLEWEEVYKNQYYGTLKSEIERIWRKKKTVIFDIDDSNLTQDIIDYSDKYNRNYGIPIIILGGGKNN